MNAFHESERLRKVFSREARGSFAVVYRALVVCSKEAGDLPLKECDVIAEIRKALRACSLAPA